MIGQSYAPRVHSWNAKVGKCMHFASQSSILLMIRRMTKIHADSSRTSKVVMIQAFRRPSTSTRWYPSAICAGTSPVPEGLVQAGKRVRAIDV